MSLNWFSMELLSTVFVFLLISVGCWAQTLDPCESARRFPYQKIRDPKNNISSYDKALTDRYIREGWYGDIGIDMPTESPGLFHCGTRFPIYLNEPLPNTNDVTNVTVCVDTGSDKCYPTFPIKVKKCQYFYIYHMAGLPLSQYFYIYHLARLPIGESAYCVGNVNQDGDPPKFTTDVNVTFDTETTNVVSLVFYCDFDLSTEEKLWYIVSWYTDDVLVYLTQPVHHNETKKTIRHKTRLTENILMDKGVESVGFHIKCSVRASYNETSATSLQSTSEGKLVGIEILTPAIDITEGEVKKIEIRSTAPIGCNKDGVNSACEFFVNINYSPLKKGNCTIEADFTNCKISIDTRDWNKVYQIPVYVKTAPVYGNDITENFIQLKTVEIYLDHKIWQNHDVGDVKLRIRKDTKSIESKLCRSTGDPHMVSFEKTGYNLQQPGTYTLYENKEWQQEVQIKTSHCSWSDEVYCNCGVAVRAGREVFILDICNRIKPLIDYGLCDEPSNLLDVRRNGTKYKIGLPSGTIVDVSIYGTFFNILVYPSAADINTSRGLCGNVNKAGDSSYEFIKREGHSEEFNQTWSVQYTLNLFKNTDRFGLKHRNISSSYCSCIHDKMNEEYKNQINCEAGCKTVLDYQPIRECKIKKSSRSKRSIRRKTSILQDQINSNLHHVYRREAGKPKWSETEARDYCKSAIDNSSAVQVCKQLPNIDLESPLNDCVFDLQASGDESFAIMSVETIKSQCFREVSANLALQEAEKGQQSIFEQVKMVACPNECTKQGNCVNGTCDCNEHFVGYDCSVDIRLPLLLDEVSDEGLCDLADDDCTEISVLGGTFVELNTSSCKIQPVEFSEKGLGKELNYTLQTSYVESIGEVICTFPKQRQRRSLQGPEMEFVKLYKVSVSNDGQVFSNETYLVVYNSGCQTCTLEDGDVQCAYKEDYCMSGGVCYQKGEPHAVDKCYLCSVTGSSRSWQYSSSPECSKASTGEEEEKSWPILVIAVVTCVVVVFSVLLIGFCCFAYRKYGIFKTVLVINKI